MRIGAAFVAVRADGAVLLRRRAERGLLGGMTEVPGTEWASRSKGLDDPAQKPIQAKWAPIPGTVVHVFTHFRLELAIWRADVPSGRESAGRHVVGGRRLAPRRGAAERDEESDRGSAAGRDQKAGSMIEIRHIVFDLGGVLIEWDPETPFQEDHPRRGRARALPRRGLHAGVEPRTGPRTNLARGGGRADRRFPEEADLIRAYREHWHDMVRGPIEANIAIVEDLIHSNVDVTALTNWALGHVPRRRSPRFPILSRFRGITVSGLVGHGEAGPGDLPPSCRDVRAGPSQTLFFDDNLANVNAARALGWNAEQYVCTDALRADLRRYGLAP